MADLYHQAQQTAAMQAAQNQLGQGLLGQAYVTPNTLYPPPILVRLSDEDIQRVVKGILDGMQERWGRRTDDRTE